MPSDTVVKVTIKGAIVTVRSQRLPELINTSNQGSRGSPVTEIQDPRTAAPQQNPEEIAVRFHGLVYKLTTTRYIREPTSHTLHLAPTTPVSHLNLNLSKLLPGRPSLPGCGCRSKPNRGCSFDQNSRLTGVVEFTSGATRCLIHGWMYLPSQWRWYRASPATAGPRA